MSSRHPGKVNYATVDARYRVLHEDQVTPAQLRSLITVADD
jgi:prepilin-type processing-associated H-X9-DG protein